MATDAEATLQKIQEQKTKLEQTQNKIDSLGQMMGVKTDKIRELLQKIRDMEAGDSNDPALREKIAELKAMMDEATKSIQAITPVQIDEIAKYNNPPERIKMGLEALMYLLKAKKLEWEDIRALMKKPNFTESVLKFNVKSVPDKVIAHVRTEYVRRDYWDMEKLKRASKAMGPLGQWLEVQVQLFEVKEKSPEASAAIDKADEIEVLKVEAAGEEMELQELREEKETAEEEKKKIEKELEVLEEARRSHPPPAPEPVEPKVVPGPPVNDGVQTDNSVLLGTYFPKVEPVFHFQTNIHSFNKYYLIDKRRRSNGNSPGNGGGQRVQYQEKRESSCQTDDFYTFEIVNGWSKRVSEVGVHSNQFPAQPSLIPVPVDAPRERGDSKTGLSEEDLAAQVRKISLQLLTREELEHELAIRLQNEISENREREISKHRSESLQIEFTHHHRLELMDERPRDRSLSVQDYAIFKKPHLEEFDPRDDQGSEDPEPPGRLEKKETQKHAYGFHLVHKFAEAPAVRVSKVNVASVPASATVTTTNRLSINELQFKNAVLTPLNGVYYEKKDQPSRFVSQNPPTMKVRSTIVRTSEAPMSNAAATIVAVPPPQEATAYVTRKVSRSYSPAPLTSVSVLANSTTQFETQSRIVQAEKLYYSSKPGPTVITSIPVPSAPLPITSKVLERDPSKSSILYPMQTIQLNESYVTNISTAEKMAVGPSPTVHRIVHAEPPSSNSYLEKDVSMHTSQLTTGKLEPTTQIRFVNHPITAPGARVLPEAYSGLQTTSDTSSVFQDTVNVQLYRPNGAPLSRGTVSPRQG